MMMAGYCLVRMITTASQSFEYHNNRIVLQYLNNPSYFVVFFRFHIIFYGSTNEDIFHVNVILPGFGECGKVFHHSSTEFSFAGRVVTRHVERMTENVFNFIGVHDSHPLPPRVRARSLFKI